MIDFSLCRRCSLGEYHPASAGEEKRIKAFVRCSLADGDLLLMNSDCPSDCPFSLEHKLTTQDVPLSFANYMSGYRRKRREAKV